MYNDFMNSTFYYTQFYLKYAGDVWAGVGPTTYTVLLISILVGGWFMLKSGMKV